MRVCICVSVSFPWFSLSVFLPLCLYLHLSVSCFCHSLSLVRLTMGGAHARGSIVRLHFTHRYIWQQQLKVGKEGVAVGI